MKNLGDLYEAAVNDRNDALNEQLSVAEFNSRTANIGKVIKILGLELTKRQFGYKPNNKLSDMLNG